MPVQLLIDKVPRQGIDQFALFEFVTNLNLRNERKAKPVQRRFHARFGTAYRMFYVEVHFMADKRLYETFIDEVLLVKSDRRCNLKPLTSHPFGEIALIELR